MSSATAPANKMHRRQTPAKRIHLEDHMPFIATKVERGVPN